MHDVPLSTSIADHTVRLVFHITFMEKLLLHLYEMTGGGCLLCLFPAHYSYGPATFREAKRDGITYILDISTYNGWMLYFYRSSNGKLAEFVSSGQTVLDIGANIGEVSLSFAKKVGFSGQVISFEPNPPIYDLLQKNCELNPDLKVVPENLALGAIEGFVEMVQPDGRNPGTVTVNFGDVGKTSCAKNVPVATLDTYIQNHSIPKVHLIKIDVEGYEGHVLQGAEKTIQRDRPILIMELVDEHQRRHGGSAGLLADKLKSYGYILKSLNSREVLPDDYPYEGCSLDVLCEPDSKR